MNTGKKKRSGRGKRMISLGLLIWCLVSLHGMAETAKDEPDSRQAGRASESLCITGLPARVNAAFKDALNVVRSEVLKGDVRKLELSARITPGSNAQISLSTWGKKKVTPPWNEYWLFFADDAPLANWAHPCRYIFVSTDLSSIIVQNALTPLELHTIGLNGLTDEESLEVVIPFAYPVRADTLEKKTTVLKTAHPRADPLVSNCYAVIISGGYNKGNNHIRYWGDAAFIYSTLTLKYGYLKTNVYALISDGLNPATDRSDDTNSPFDLDGDGEPDTCADATATSVSNVLLYLQTILTTNDQLLIFTTDHGGPTTGGGEWDTELNLWNLNVLTDSDMAALTTNIACPILFAMEQCYSGGFLDNLDQSNRIIATAAQYNESSYAGVTYPDYDQWCYHWTAAMNGHYPTVTAQTPWVDGDACNADTNGDGCISFREACDYAYAHKYPDDHPMYQSVPDDLGERTFLGSIGMSTFAVDPVTSPQTTNLPVNVRITTRNPFGLLISNATDQAFLQGVGDPVGPGLYVGQAKSTWNYPLEAYYEDARTQVIYPTNLMDGPCTLTNLALNVTRLPGGSLSNWTIRMKHTDLDAYTDEPVWESGDWAVVFQTNAAGAEPGWVYFEFSTPFEYNGTNNLMIDFSFNNTNYSSSGYCRADTASVVRSIMYCTDSGYGDPLDWSGTNPPPSVGYIFPCLCFGPPSVPASIAIEPTNIHGFIDGVWTGEVRILEPVTNMWIHVVGTNANWTGNSNPFAVWRYRLAFNNIESVADSDSTVLQWESGTNVTYSVFVSTNLDSGFSSVLATNLPATPPLNTYTDTTLSVGHRFYRVGEE